MADAVQFMKEKITNTFVIKDQKFLTPKSWRKAWSEWGNRDTELSEISAKIMHHSVAIRNKFYLNHVNAVQSLCASYVGLGCNYAHVHMVNKQKRLLVNFCL